MRRFLSWDCGNKSLAYAHVTIDTTIMTSIQKYNESVNLWCEKYPNAIAEWARADCVNTPAMCELFAILQEITAAIDGFITFHNVGVKDILNGRKVSDVDEVQRTIALHKFLEESPVSNAALAQNDFEHDCPTEIIIEHQPSKVGMATNNKSTMIGHQLMFYYVTRRITLISPKLKNKISMPGIVYTPTYGGASTPYYARKKHSKDLFLRLMEVLGKKSVYAKIPMSGMDDLADAVLQILTSLRFTR